MKKLIIIIAGVIWAQFSFAQEKKQYEVKDFGGIVKINGPSKNLKITGYDGSSVIIEAQAGDGKLPEKAEGLKILTAGGVDNTGLAVNVEDYFSKVVTSINEDGIAKEEEIRTLEINIPNSNNLFKNYEVKVPKKSRVLFQEDRRPAFGEPDGALNISSLEGELEVNCSDCKLLVSNFSGNIIANNSATGQTKIEFVKLPQNKLSSINSGRDVEVLLPIESKANLSLNALSGNIYTNFDLVKAKESDGNIGNSYSNHSSDQGFAKGGGSYTITSNGYPTYPTQNKINVSNITGGSRINEVLFRASGMHAEKYGYTVNGGGVYLNITSTSGNIYLKKR